MGQQGFDWGASPQLPSDPSARLRSWPPALNDLLPGWREPVQAFLESDTGRALSDRLQAALAQGQTIYPSDPFRALTLTALADVRVVILGQDPYHGPGQAEGLAFSVAPGVKPPPSLRNIFKELHASLGLPTPNHGSLVHWAKQGVLLLNTCLTVQEALAASHARWGWETLTDDLIAQVAARAQPTVFMLWGAHAQSKRVLIEETARDDRHLLLLANHPSPLSALRPPQPFIGCQHFALAHAFLQRQGLAMVDW
jgi:uracil-DNA glycosylase